MVRLGNGRSGWGVEVAGICCGDVVGGFGWFEVGRWFVDVGGLGGVGVLLAMILVGGSWFDSGRYCMEGGLWV